MKAVLVICLCVCLHASSVSAATTAVKNDDPKVVAAFKIAETTIADLNPEASPFDIKSAALTEAQAGQDGSYTLKIEGTSASGEKSPWIAIVKGDKVDSVSAGEPPVPLIIGGQPVGGFSNLSITDAKAVKAFDVAKKAIFDFNPEDSIFDIKSASLISAKVSGDEIKLQLSGTNSANVSNVWEAVVKGSNVTDLSSFGDKSFVPLIVNGSLADGYVRLSNDDQKVKDALAIAQPIILDLNDDASPFDIKSSRLLDAKYQPKTGIVSLSIEGTSEDKTKSNWGANVDLAKKEVTNLSAFGPTDKAFVDIPKVDGKFVGAVAAAAPGPSPVKPSSAGMIPANAMMVSCAMVFAAAVMA